MYRVLLLATCGGWMVAGANYMRDLFIAFVEIIEVSLLPSGEGIVNILEKISRCP